MHSQFINTIVALTMPIKSFQVKQRGFNLIINVHSKYFTLPVVFPHGQTKLGPAFQTDITLDPRRLLGQVVQQPTTNNNSIINSLILGLEDNISIMGYWLLNWWFKNIRTNPNELIDVSDFDLSSLEVTLHHWSKKLSLVIWAISYLSILRSNQS